jgi:hypothetical protein
LRSNASPRQSGVERAAQQLDEADKARAGEGLPRALQLIQVFYGHDRMIAGRAVRRRAIPLLVIGFACLGVSCAILGSRSASSAERAKIDQLVGPLSQRAVPLRAALAAIVDAAPLPVKIDVCTSLEEEPVTILTLSPEEFGVLVRGVAMQVGAPLRLFIGHHGEVAHPTLFCPERGGTLATIAKAQSRASVP